MRIGFDARYAEGDLVGIGNYIKSLVLQLDKLGVHSVLFYSKKPEIPIKGMNIKTVVLKTHNRYFFEQILLPWSLSSEKVDLYHALGNVGIPVVCPVPALLTVHDIIPLEIKKYFSYSPIPFLSKLSYLFRVKSSMIKSSKIITVSDYVKKELIKRLNVDTSKIITIYSGKTDLITSGDLPKYLVGQKYILNNGGIDIRKNLDNLIKAFSSVISEISNIKLVITGKNIRIRKNLEVLVNKLGLTGNVLFTGYVNNKTLQAIIKSATLICYPTLSEGFGFPIIEAFSQGVPVISSNTSSIPEIAKDAALLVNPRNEKEIAEAILNLLNDKNLVEILIKKGYKRADDFSWEKAAIKYLSLYMDVSLCKK